MTQPPDGKMRPGERLSQRSAVARLSPLQAPRPEPSTKEMLAHHSSSSQGGSPSERMALSLLTKREASKDFVPTETQIQIPTWPFEHCGFGKEYHLSEPVPLPVKLVVLYKPISSFALQDSGVLMQPVNCMKNHRAGSFSKRPVTACSQG